MLDRHVNFGLYGWLAEHVEACGPERHVHQAPISLWSFRAARLWVWRRGFVRYVSCQAESSVERGRAPKIVVTLHGVNLVHLTQPIHPQIVITLHVVKNAKLNTLYTGPIPFTFHSQHDANLPLRYRPGAYPFSLSLSVCIPGIDRKSVV